VLLSLSVLVYDMSFSLILYGTGNASKLTRYAHVD